MQGSAGESQVEVQHCHQYYKQEHRCWESAVSIKFIFLLSAAKANFEEATQTVFGRSPLFPQGWCLTALDFSLPSSPSHTGADQETEYSQGHKADK